MFCVKYQFHETLVLNRNLLEYKVSVPNLVTGLIGAEMLVNNPSYYPIRLKKSV